MEKGKKVAVLSGNMKSEASIQSSIILWFRNNYCLKTHNPRYCIFSVPNDGKNATEQMRKIANGMMSGVSDLIVLMENKCYFFELKTEVGKQSDKQKDFQIQVEKLGFKYFLVRNLFDFQNIILHLHSENTTNGGS
jgi:hypothetical protein